MMEPVHRLRPYEGNEGHQPLVRLRTDVGRRDTGTTQAGDNGIDIAAIIGTLRRRKALIFITVVVITCLTILGTLQITPRYTATAAVMIDPHEMREIDTRSVAEGLPPWLPGDRSVVATQLKVLQSRSHAERVIATLGLAHDPEFNRPGRSVAGEIELLARQWLPESLAAAIGLFIQPRQSAEPATMDPADRTNLSAEGFGTGSPEPVVERFLDKLSVRQEEGTHVLTVSFTSIDPGKAARIANAVVTSYVAGQLEAKAQTTERASAWVAERIEHLREQVLQAERASEEYRAANDLLDSQAGSLDAQRLANTNAELIVVRADRMAKEARLDQVKQAKGNHYAFLTEETSSPILVGLREQEARLRLELSQLSEEHGERHPRLLQVKAARQNLAEKIEEEIANLIRTLENEVGVSRARERALEAGLEEAKGRSALARKAAIQLRDLERDAGAKRSIYEGLLARSREIEEQRDLLKPDAKMISRAAAPEEPSFPKLGIMTTIGFTASLIIGLLLVALAEHFNRGLHNGRQIEQAFGLPSFGLVPKIERLGRRQTPYSYLLGKPVSAYADAVKTVQMAIQLSGVDVSPQVVLVTSTLPGEGKTTIAVSLGASAARLGRKTLVMDLDLRHPSVARQLDCRAACGLVEFMTGECSLDEIIWTDSKETNLHVIPVISRSAGPSEMLSSEKMRSLLAELRRRYEYIVLDTPPALGPSDANMAALLADAVVYVVQWHKTTEVAVANGLEALARTRAPVAGVVLTQVNLRRHIKYGYEDVGHYYGKYGKY